jgi:ABC-type polysaccharide/polyol phosphate transport system ATPase subunit
VVKRQRAYDGSADALPAASAAAIQMDHPKSAANGVEVRNVTKRFRVSTETMGRMSSFLFHRLISGARRENFYAVKDVSFDIKRGEMLGILGVNGSGKSTLLKMITGITAPTSGDIRRLPRIAPLLDLSAGFHPALSGYENIFLNGSIIGLQREEIRELLPHIISFSGLDHKFLEAPVRTYSAGMMARLGFALAVSVDPDVILIDEVLAVGDLEFQAKSAQKLLEFRDQGKAMALVSHTSAAIGELSTEAIWLHQGEMKMEGYAPDVVAEYNAHLTEQVRRAGRDMEHQASAANPNHANSAAVRFRDCTLKNEHGKETAEFETKGHLELSFEIRAGNSGSRAESAAGAPIDLQIVLQYQTGIVVEEFYASERGFTPVALQNESCRVTITFDPLLLLHGEYIIEITAVQADSPEVILGHSPEIPFEVGPTYTSFGVYPAFIPVEFRME